MLLGGVMLVPALKVTPAFFDYVENGLNELPEALFLDLEDYQNPYCFIISDEKRSLVVDTLGYHTPIRKSRMLFEEETLMLRYLRYELMREYTYEQPEEEITLYTLSPKYMLGLTREEREKKYLLMEAMYLLKNESKAKIFYYFMEFDSISYQDVKNLKKAALLEQFVQLMKEGWTEKHEYLLHLLLKENEDLQLLYEVLI